MLWLSPRIGLLAALCIASACNSAPDASADSTRAASSASAASAPSVSDVEREARARKEQLDREYPLHGLVTGTQLKVRLKPDPEATVVGWVRIGARLRLADEPEKTRTCSSGFYRVHPLGYVCAGEGVEVGKEPPESLLAVAPATIDAPLPYAYYFVKEPKVPEYHRLPSRDEQREVRDFLSRHDALLLKSPEKAPKLLRGELPGEPKPPLYVRRFLDRGFFVAGAGLEERASRMFVRTVRGSYVKQGSLEERKGSSFRGVELGAPSESEGGAPVLPVAWAVREAQPFEVKKRDDGSLRLVSVEGAKPYARLSIVPWAGRERIGDDIFHKLADGTYVKSWFLAVAEPIERPKQVPAKAPWVHVNLEQQTLVAYRGDAPVYTTLVSTGLAGHDTPIGLFDIRQKYVANGMSDLGPEAGDDRYSIDDVPWTQYFSGSIALHGAFWHERFGLRRSHGCVNLAPYDAHRVWNHTWPEIGQGWHGAITDQTSLPTSKVLVSKSARAEDVLAALSPQKSLPETARAPASDEKAQ